MTPARSLALGRLMSENGFNQSGLARDLEVSRGTVARWLKGTTPVPVAVIRWLTILGQLRDLTNR
jgi:transcriptional regulator with XRE-family HTH domain